MPPLRSVSLLNRTSTHGRDARGRHFVLLCALAALCAGVLALPPTGESVQKRKAKSPAGSGQKQKSPEVAKPTTQGTQERGIVNTDVPEFKADTPATALVIGISLYPNLQSSAQLRFAHSDAQAVRDFLVSEKGGFRPEDVTLLLNEDATRDQIMRAVGTLQERTGPIGLALIFFAGHGVVTREGQAFLIASDTKANDLYATGIEMTSLNAIVQKMRARSVVIMTDACHSGALGDVLRTGPGKNVSAKYFDEPTQRIDQSSFIFSASSPEQSSIEDSDLKGGLFTHFTLQGLDGAADEDSNGVITSMELYNYVLHSMSVETRRRNIAQVPEHNVEYDRSIPLAIVSDPGRARYKDWFSQDARFAFLLAAFNEALEQNRLTTPQDQSAWDYLSKLKNNPGTPVGVANEKQELFLKRVLFEAEKVLSKSPIDHGIWDESASNLEKAYQLTRDSTLRAKQYFCEVMSLRVQGDLAKAEHRCDSTLDVIEREGTADHSITIKIGQFYRELERWAKADRAYRLANNKSAGEITEHAEVLTKLDRYSDAEDQLRQALKTNADYRPALILLSELLLRTATKERVAEVLTHTTRALQLAPEDIEAEELFGRTKLFMNDTQNAIASLVKVARLRPRGERRNRSLSYLSESYWRGGDIDRAISALREAEESNPQNVEVLDSLAERLAERGNVNDAITSAEKVAQLTVGKIGHAAKVHKLAEYLERAGQLENAAYKYREAAELEMDSRLGSTWATHAKVLFLRIGKNSEANVPRPAPMRERETQWQTSPISIPGGLEALRQLTGLTITSDDKSALSRVFDAALRDPAIAAHLVDFYSDLPVFARKLGMEGDALSGTLTLPGPTQTPSIVAREALKFFGVTDKKGLRQIKAGEFDSRRYMLEALGGDSEKLKNGEPVGLTIRSGELLLVHAFEIWILTLKDGYNIKPDQQFLAFLKSPAAMRLYVGLSMLPEQSVIDLQTPLFRSKTTELMDAVYFAAPYLRFDQRGKLKIPGGGQGESNWREALKTTSTNELLRALFYEKENRGALYLFCALSSSGEIGDAISGSRKTSFDIVFNLFRKSPVTGMREPFDFIDFLAHLRLENDQLRLPNVVEFWQKSISDTGEPHVIGVLSRLGKVSAGAQIPLVKQIAVLTQIERERPDWATDRDVVERIAKLTTANRESQLETALDLEMNGKQLINYLDLVDRIDALPLSPAKTSAIRSFQSTLELLRHLANNLSISPARIAESIDRVLQADPARNDYGVQLFSLLTNDVLNAGAQTPGSEVEAKFIASVAYAPPVEIPSLSTNQTAANGDAFLLDSSEFARAEINKFLAEQKHTRLASVYDAVTAIDELDKNPSATESLDKLKTAIAAFVDFVPPIDTKKKKSKAPVVQEINLKTSVAQLSLPVDGSAISAIRSRIAPYAGEALLAQVYAVSHYPKLKGGILRPDLIKTHDFETLPWGATQVGPDGKVRGNLSRLNHALARLSMTSPTSSTKPSAWVAASLSSFQGIKQPLVTREAEEFVARAMDLGEDVLALYKQGDESAADALNQLDTLLSQRRFVWIKTLVDRADIMAALRTLTPSELYMLGRIYLDKQLANVPLASLKNEPGSLGVLARYISQTQTNGPREIPAKLLRGITQFGTNSSSVSGLNRFGLFRREPYEYSAGFSNEYRLAERIQDLKLALARRAHRTGGSAMIPLNIAVADAVLNSIMNQTRKASRSAATPERDWQSLIAAIQWLNEEEFAKLINQMAGDSYVRSVPRNNWNDPRTIESKTQP